jgi:hypothetical protein
MRSQKSVVKIAERAGSKFFFGAEQSIMVDITKSCLACKQMMKNIAY